MTYIVQTKIQWLHQSSLRHEYFLIVNQFGYVETTHPNILGGFGQIAMESSFFLTQSIAF